jgi:hypothetical protein
MMRSPVIAVRPQAAPPAMHPRQGETRHASPRRSPARTELPPDDLRLAGLPHEGIGLKP